MNKVGEKLSLVSDKFNSLGVSSSEKVGEKLWQGLDSLLKPENLKPAEGLAPKDLLLLQVKASSYHLRVELVSKAAESLLATVRKFQNA